MKFNDAFPSRYLRGSDLEDGEKIFAEISHVERRIIGRANPLEPHLSNSDRAAAVKAATEAEAKATEAIKVETRKPALAGAKRGDLDDEIPF
jgi:hypothetical protein